MTTHINPHALQAIKSLQRPGKPDLLQRIVELFKTETPKALGAIQDGVNAGDMDAVRNAAHTLKSSSAYVGAHVFSDRCRDLERAAREGNFPACIALGDGLDEMFTASCSELDVHMGKAA